MILLLLIATALLGLVLTAIGLPGVWLFLLLAAVLPLLGSATAPSGLALGIGFGLALVAEVIEWVAQVRWTGRSGGSRRAGWAALAGGILGAFAGVPIPVLGPIIGSFAGSFLGALIAEYSRTRDSSLAGKVAWGALMGRVAATTFKIALGVVVAVVIIGSAWR
jgi:uncharacterized protein YqgC (DUF456 family)